MVMAVVPQSPSLDPIPMLVICLKRINKPAPLCSSKEKQLAGCGTARRSRQLTLHGSVWVKFIKKASYWEKHISGYLWLEWTWELTAEEAHRDGDVVMVVVVGPYELTVGGFSEAK
jgi:hypothetical protein